MTFETLAIVPARGGSKRLPGKNLQSLGGKPLVCHTLDAAQDSGCFSRILLSSDQPEILCLADNYTSVEAMTRPEELSGDLVTALTLVNSIVEDPQIHTEFQAVALLLPTAPFRTAKHIQEGIKLLTPEVDGVISLTSYEFPPQLSVTLKEGEVQPIFEPCPLITGDTRSQDQETIYRPNGGFYIQWMSSFLCNQNFWKGQVKGYIMSRRESVDIDDLSDLKFAEYLISNGS